MPVFNAKMDTAYYDDTEAEEHDDCEVHLDGSSLTVVYEEDGNKVEYRGQDQGGGHYLLESIDPPGKATLHRMAESKILEGYWKEDGERGFWKIRLMD